MIAQDLARLGWHIEEYKGVWEPAQSVELLGLIINTLDAQVQIPKDKVQKMKTKISEAFECAKKLTPRDVASLSRTVISVSKSFSPTGLYTRTGVSTN